MGQSDLSVHLTMQAEHVHLISSRFHRAGESQELQVLILALQQELGLRCCSLRVQGHSNSSYGLEELSNAQELLLHAHAVSVHSPHEGPPQLLKENDCHLAPDGFPLVGPVFLPCQGLVLCNVQDHRGLA